jgi:hypothetical protein
MTAAAVYGDIGLIGTPNDQLTTPVTGITDIQATDAPALYAREITAVATRTLDITILPGQSLSVTVDPSGVFGGLNADVKARVNGGDYATGAAQTVDLAPGVYDLDIGISATVRGGCVMVPLVDYTIEADPANDLQDESGNDNHATIASLRRKAGVTQRAIAFEGEPDHIEIPDLGWTGTASRGLSLWLKDAGDGPLCQLSPNASIEIDAGTVKIKYLGSDTALHTGSVNDTDWHHLLIWIDSGGTISTWLDTDAAEDVTLSVDHGAAWEMEFGRSGSRYWTGTIDEIVLLETEPTAIEIARMKGSQNPLDGSLYAERLHGQPVYPVVIDSSYPPNPVRGQTVITWNGSAAQLETFIDGAWRTL